MVKSIKLNTDTTKDIVNSLCVALHNNRAVTFKSNEISGSRTGKIKTMDNLFFEITGSNWFWEYSEITEIYLN